MGFTEHLITSSSAGAMGLSVADLDSDGDAEVVVANQGLNEIAWFENDGLGSFSTEIRNQQKPGVG